MKTIYFLASFLSLTLSSYAQNCYVGCMPGAVCPDGDFYASCVNCTFKDYTLTCYCADEHHQCEGEECCNDLDKMKKTSFNFLTDIQMLNQNGKLYPFYKR